MKKQTLTVIVLAAGHGSRMQSHLPKPLYPVAGKPMILRLIQAIQGLKGKLDLKTRIVVNQKGKKQISEALISFEDVFYVEQESPKGTGDAVKLAFQAKPIESDLTLILNADHPLITSQHLNQIVQAFQNQVADLALVTAIMDKPGSLGRVIKDNGKIQKIVESHQADSQVLKIKQVNAGIYLAKTQVLSHILPDLSYPSKDSKQTECYLTDILPLFLKSKMQKDVLDICMDEDVAYGVNSQQDLAVATQRAFQRKNQHLMSDGVTLIDPQTTYIEDDVQIQPGTLIYPNNFFKGKSQIGKDCLIESNCTLQDVFLEDGVQVRAGSYLEDCQVGHHCLIGPYARLRPQTHIGPHCKIGNFVELKKAKLADHVKASHLSYLGDVDVESNVNIGCGVITCNYREDHKKYKTHIAKDVFVGSDVQLVAPVKVGQGAIIGSGSTITKDVPAGSLALSRGEQVIKPEWALQKR